MNIELRWLRAFVTVAEEGHFSRAASRLNLAQPALTAQIQHLEEAVGAKLLERTNRLNGLTSAGHALLPEARLLVSRADGLAARAREAARGEVGLLRLGLIPPAATRAVADSLRDFARTHPAVEIEVRHDTQDRLETLLADGELDLVLGRPAERAGLGQQRLFVETQGVLLHAKDPLAELAVVPLKALSGRRLILLRDNPHFGRNFLDLAARHGVGLQALRSAEDFPSMHWMVRAGLGVAPCSLLLGDSLGTGLTARPLKPRLPTLPIHALWRGPAVPPAANAWLRRFVGPNS